MGHLQEKKLLRKRLLTSWKVIMSLPQEIWTNKEISITTINIFYMLSNISARKWVDSSNWIVVAAIT
ncbi:hypothetical protein CR513_29174, partial [Mucuna pruriens]